MCSAVGSNDDRERGAITNDFIASALKGIRINSVSYEGSVLTVINVIEPLICALSLCRALNVLHISRDYLLLYKGIILSLAQMLIYVGVIFVPIL